MEQNGQLIPLFKDYQETDLFPDTQEKYFISKIVYAKFCIFALMSCIKYRRTESLSEADEQGRQAVPTPNPPANCFVGSAFQVLYIPPSLG